MVDVHPWNTQPFPEAEEKADAPEPCYFRGLCYSLRYIICTPVRIIYYRTYQFQLTYISRSRFISDR